MDPLVEGFAMAGFRSFKANLQVFGGLKKITILAGPNNSGKSNVLRLLQGFLRGDPETRSEYDVPWLAGNQPMQIPQEIAIAKSIDDQQIRDLVQRAGGINPHSLQDFMHGMRSGAIAWERNDGPLWFAFKKADTANAWSFSDTWIEQATPSFGVATLQDVSAAVSSGYSSDRAQNLVNALNALNPLASMPPVRTLEAFRQIDNAAESSNYTPDGSNLVSAISRLMQPSPTKRGDRARFDAINLFVKSVLGDENAELSVSREPEELTVDQDGVVLPLSSLGTGIHQVIIIAAVCTLFTRTLICLEEPEVHLHPLLQRKLALYLSQNTENQYVIATHSAHMFDVPNSCTFHLQRTVDGTVANRADTPAKLARICDDLGYRPSDLLHSNFVIWVEGPSDRVYLRHWLSLTDPELIEHVHFTIMFYGGRLLRHLSADDADVDDFIRLKTLNRSLAIVIDSDQTKASDTLNATKRRVLDEIEAAGDFSIGWVTAGREIENYVPADLMATAVAESQPTKPKPGRGRYVSILSSRTKPAHDKLRVARAVAEQWTSETTLQYDLAQKLEDLITIIRRANGMANRP